MPEVESPFLASFALSREELLLILNLLKANYIFGLEPDPAGQLSADQTALGLLHAERALRARELARLNEDGQLIILDALLISVGVCAYPQWTVLAHHFSLAGDASRYFGHQRENHWVGHTVLDEGTLHLFVLFKNKEALLDQVVYSCESDRLPLTRGPVLKVKENALKQARAYAEQGDAAQTMSALSGQGVEAELAHGFATLLTEPHNVSLLHTLTPMPGNQFAKRELTVIHNSREAWLMVQSAEDAAKNVYTLKPVDTAELKNLLSNL